MSNFDKKDHIKSPEFYRNTAKKVVLDQDVIYATVGIALRMELLDSTGYLYRLAIKECLIAFKTIKHSYGDKTLSLINLSTYSLVQ